MADEAPEQTPISPECAEDVVSNWPAVQYDVSPYKTYHFFHQFRTNESNPNNFLKGVKWSPDGSCFLTCNEDNTLRVFSLPYNDIGDPDAPTSTPDSDSYGPNVVVSEGESAYDYCWYPYMSASNPDLCVFATSTRDHPIHLWDANSGQLRCTYRAYDAMDEITAAFSIGFNPGGNKIFAGYNKAIRIFDVHRPGRDFEQHSTVLGNKEGQSEKTIWNCCMCCMAKKVQFSKDGNYLYTGGRKDPHVICWDIRKTVDIVYKLYRSTEGTNQRIQFDIEPLGRYLGTGGQDGLVHIYDLQTGEWVSSFQAALDTVNGFGFHPFLPMAATSSGHRRYIAIDDSEEDKTLSGDENCVSIWSFYSSGGGGAVEGVADVSN
ncbi:telomerase Cajal body protein 1 isoform X3 [Salvia hispanica]|uniref:telomerase Cajal body protein 1 isoform X3 n=1 Tax=Salvia hispanica TaxID=49212 RepID=UPI0020096545|nr:telomerase Cajal body protein 1 isoform X3 [Salvia hispanica]